MELITHPRCKECDKDIYGIAKVFHTIGVEFPVHLHEACYERLKEIEFMKLEDQVASLELSKRLKELGVKQNSLFSWNKQRYGCYLIGNNPNYDSNIIDECIAALTVAELGKILPRKITVNTINYYYTQMPCEDLKTWSIFYRNDFSGMPNCDIYDKNEANARAKMRIYLLENGLIKND